MLPSQPGTATGRLPGMMVGNEQGCASAGIGGEWEDSTVSVMGGKLSGGNGSVILGCFSGTGSDQETKKSAELSTFALQ